MKWKEIGGLRGSGRKWLLKGVVRGKKGILGSGAEMSEESGLGGTRMCHETVDQLGLRELRTSLGHLIGARCLLGLFLSLCATCLHC